MPYPGGRGTNSGQKPCALPPRNKDDEGCPIVTNISIDKPPCPSAISSGKNTQASGTPSNTTSHSITYVHNFLQNCAPPLDHLLSRFIDVGFHNPDMLREVAKKWTGEERRELMKRVAPGLDGKVMTELELASLEKGFLALRSAVYQ